MRQIPLASIRDFFRCDHVIFAGSGTVALYLALKAIDVKNKKVILPALTCPNVAISVFAAGGIPTLVDVSKNDCNISIESVEQIIDESCRAIIAVDSFGYPADIGRLKAVASPYDCIIIEDACQAYGGEVDGTVIGTRGDIGIISFGYSKPVPVERGGCVLTHSKELSERIMNMKSSWDFDILNELKSKIVLRLALEGRSALLRIAACYLGMLRYSFPSRWETDFAKGWAKFLAELETIKCNLNIVQDLVASFPGVELFEYSKAGWLPWRYSFRLEDPTFKDGILKLLLNNGIRTTHLYRPINEFLPVSVARPLASAKTISDQIVNLAYWTSQEDTASLISRLQRALQSL